MRPTPVHKSEAFTVIELTLVILVVLVLMFMLRALLTHVEVRPPRIQCLNNLKQIGTAYLIWANDHHNHFPPSEPLANGGWREFLANADQGFICWTNYVIMSNELGQASKLLVCPSDERKPVVALSNFVSDNNLSYFVGVSADQSRPMSLLAGDRNLGAGTEPDLAYGFSPANGQGNDIAIQTNSKAGPVCWSSKMHSQVNLGGAGNIMLADDSAQEVSSLEFRSNWQPVAGQTTNWPAGHVPSAPSIRVLFP
jgi:hypothetical protein